MKRLIVLLMLVLCGVVVAQDAPSVTVAPVDIVAVTPGKSAPVKISFRISNGFHINSNKPNSELLIPTEFKFSLPTELMIAGVQYPEGQQITLPFMPNEKLSVYSGDVNVVASLRAAQNASAGTYRVHAQLKFQACSDRQCFPPKTTPVDFDVKVAKAAHSHKSHK